MPPRTQKLIAALRSWCDERYGRRSEIGRTLGVGLQVITNWFAGRQEPTGEQALAVQEFLARQKSRRKPTH